MIRRAALAAVLVLSGCASEPEVCFSVVYDRPFMVAVDDEVVAWHGALDPVDLCVTEDQEVFVVMVPLL